jgi:anti-anti-sigma factor
LSGEEFDTMKLSTYANGEGFVVEVAGSLTADQPLRQLPATVERVLSDESPPAVKVNVGKVELVDLEGVAALARAYKIVTARGARFALVDGQPRLRRRLEQTGLLRLLEEGAP